MEAVTGRRISGSAIWSLAERVSAQGITFVVTLIMARILTPEDFGLVGMLTIFVELGATLCTSGLTHALIKQKGGTPVQKGSVLLFNILSGTLLYLLIWVCAPLIADFYEIPELCRLARLISIVIPLRGMSVIAEAQLLSCMDFRRIGIASVSALTAGGATGIILACRWKNVDAIVGFQIANAAFNLIMLFAVTFSRLKISFMTPKEILPLLKFGMHISGSAIADFIYSNSYLIAIGKLFPASDVGYFSRSRQLASVPPISIGMIMRKVTYPVLCRCGDDLEKMGDTAMRILRIAMYVTMPLMVTVALNSNPIVLTLLGEKWRYSAELLPILCLATVFTPLDGINLIMLPACGRPELMLRLELGRKLVGIIALVCSLPYGIKGICAGYAAASLAGTVMCLLVSRAVSKVSVGRQIWAALKFLIPAVVAAAIPYLAAIYTEAEWLRLLIGCIGSVLLYLLITYRLRYVQLAEITTALRQFAGK